ncbi:TetR/AcrR family transcriptional regulator [Microbacterium saperdae]
MTSDRRGRPRSERARSAILEATRDLLIERGYDKVTMIAIADRAGVGRQTLYRWWPDKAVIVAECVLDNFLPFSLIVAVGSGDAEGDLQRWLTESYEEMRREDGASLFRALTAAASDNEAIARRLVDELTGPLRGSLAQLLLKGVESGQFRADAPLEAVTDLLFGAMMVAIVSRDTPSKTRAEEVADVILRGLAG